uniref:Uncharacterized protein n=1 Tax=Oryza sativa subsp. japonica TaxID=39947 RepID=Q6EN54_ORYSJ|nr:hypothetical protein [Oryza sativa Japonica Group]BAD29681.1 hypothetical protein [Oryza sativa Japonica Group]
MPIHKIICNLQIIHKYKKIYKKNLKTNQEGPHGRRCFWPATTRPPPLPPGTSLASPAALCACRHLPHPLPLDPAEGRAPPPAMEMREGEGKGRRGSEERGEGEEEKNWHEEGMRRSG